MWKKLLLAALLGWGAYNGWASRSVSHGPGVVAPQEPVQHSVSDTRAFDFNGHRITPLAEFSIEARVLSREDYRIGPEAAVSPTDLVFGWGRMSDEAVLEKIDVSQSNRFYYWSVGEFPIPQREIETHSGNMHIIPADKSIERVLKDVRKGQVVRVSGYLVRVDSPDDWHWVSSLSRKDTGAGACELIWAENLTIIR
jgi:hypothetical protein